MNYRNWDFTDEQIPETFVLIVYEDGDEILEKEFSSLSFDSSDVIEKSFPFENNEGVSFYLVAIITQNGVEINIETEDYYYDMDRIEFNLVNVEQKETPLSLDFYMPTLSYTKTTSSILFDLADSDKIIPLIDITQLDRFDEYAADELINYLHYLDLNGIEKIINNKERDEIKKLRKEQKSIQGEASAKIPDYEYLAMEFLEVIKLFTRINDKTKVIPCFTWGDASNFTALQLFNDALKDEYQTLAIRVVEFSNFQNQLSSIRAMADFHIILDMNTNKDLSFIEPKIKQVQTESFQKIIYLGTPFTAQELSISIHSGDINTNVIRDNTSLMILKSLYALGYTDVKYGDYCGYDRRTLIKHPKGGTPTARVVLLSLEPTETILIRRGWDSRDKLIGTGGRTLIGSKFSMTRLLKDIHDGFVDHEMGIQYLDETTIDVDEALKDQYPDNTSAGIIKTWCLRHNISAICKTYL